MRRTTTYDLDPLPTTTLHVFSLCVLAFSVLIAKVMPLPSHQALMMLVGIVIVVAAQRRRPPNRFPTGDVFRGRIESKAGPYALRVVGGELRATPFVVRLCDGRVALVEDTGLVLEAESGTTGLDVGVDIELIGHPTTTHAAIGYRGALALHFEGSRTSPVGLRCIAA